MNALSRIRSVDYVVLLCERMEKTRAFYEDVLGFAVEHDSPNWISFRVGPVLLTLKPRGPGLAWEDGAKIAGSADVQLAFRVPPSEIQGCLEELVAKGVEILEGPSDLTAWRHRVIFFRDPEGNVLEIYAEV